MEDIGIRLKKARMAQGLSQRQLAKSSGVSNAMICLIERGKSNPSLGLLKNVLDVIPISVSEFFSLELEDKPAKVFYEKDELTEIGSGLIDGEFIESLNVNAGGVFAKGGIVGEGWQLLKSRKPSRNISDTKKLSL